jgi:hypothetical protein
MRTQAFGVYTLDPGGKSGTARGVFIPQRTIVSTLRAHTVEAAEWTGDPIIQAANIARDYYAWRRQVYAAGVERIELVIESFKLRQVAVELSPVEVTAALRAYLRVLKLPDVTCYQSASQAMSHAPHQRLKRWGMYSAGRGSDHKRDALRHLALRVSNIIEEEFPC